MSRDCGGKILAQLGILQPLVGLIVNPGTRFWGLEMEALQGIFGATIRDVSFDEMRL